MRAPTLFVAFSSLFVSLSNSVAAQSPTERTADDIIALNVAARGGIERLSAIKTQRLVGRIVFNDTTTGLDTVELARPRRIRTVLVLNNQRVVQAYDGNTAWTINPFTGAATPTTLQGNDAKNIAADANIDGPFVNYKKKGNQVTYAGIDTADGQPAYKLDVRTADGFRDSYFIDTTTHLQTKWRGKRTFQGTEVTIESYFRDYRTVDGIKVAFLLDSHTIGTPDTQHMIFESVQTNVPLPNDRFQRPAK